jgi:small-conductance mechanosensitive channel/ferredoxin
MRIIRLVSGLLLFGFVTLHLGNLALGLVSIETMDAWAPVLMFSLYHRPTVYLLYAAATLHVVGALHAILIRRSLQLRLTDAMQLALGLLIPLLLVAHVLGLRGGIERYGIYGDFRWMLAFYWKFAPAAGLRQVFVLVVVWAHGCIGLYGWLRLRAWWPRVAGFIYPIVFLLPILALLGFVEGGKEALARLASDSDFTQRIAKKAAERVPAIEPLGAIHDGVVALYLLLIAALAVAAWWRHRARRARLSRVDYVDGPTVEAPRGLSILEVSRAGGVPHADVCSGRARCGTCRVRVIAGRDALSPIAEPEAAMLRRLQAGDDVRLACQAVVEGRSELRVERLVPADADASASVDRGRIVAVAIMGWIIASPGVAWAASGEVASLAIQADLQRALESAGREIRELILAVAGVSLTWERAVAGWRAMSGDSETLRATTQALILVLIGVSAEWLYWCYALAARKRLELRDAAGPGAAFGLVSRRLGLEGAALAIFCGATLLASVAFAWPTGVLALVTGLVLTTVVIRTTQLFGRFALSPRAPALRLVALDDRTARLVHGKLIAFATAASLAWLAGAFVMRVGELAAPGVLLRALLGIVSAAIAVSIAQDLRRVDARDTAGVGGSLTFFLIVAMIVATTLLWLVGFRRAAQSVMIVGGFFAIDWVLRHIGQRVRDGVRADAEDDAALTVYRPLFLRIARLVMLIVAAVILLLVWDVPILQLADMTTTGARMLQSLISVAIVALIADILWVWARTAIDRRMPRPSAGESLSAASRLGTLLPLLRTFLLTVLLIVVALTALAALGVEIGPLLAGAGIVGIAIGFGAQTLVKDIISGLFFLLEDAFRVGEYVESGNIRGTVEGFSMRSMKLRHHRGALHTLPFGELRSITNYSRDWVIDKINFGVTYDTDLNKIKKIVKNVSKELMADEELARVILEPLKSQGVSKLGDFAIEIRLKVKTKPGEQFIVRRAVYARIKEAFDANGIRFAFPTVTVAGGEGAAAAAGATITGDKSM